MALRNSFCHFKASKNDPSRNWLLSNFLAVMPLAIMKSFICRTAPVGIAVHQLDIQTGLSEPPLGRGNSYPVSARPIKGSDPDGWQWGGGISRGWPAVAQDCHRRRAEEQVPGRDRAQSPPNTDQVAETKQ